MKRMMTHVLTTVALIMTLGLTAYASDGHDRQHDGSDATTAATMKPAEGHPGRHKDGHPN